MSTPSITLRIDLGDAAAGGGSGVGLMHGEAPQPMASMSPMSSLSSLAPLHFAGANTGDLPTPFAGFAHAADHGAAPTPMGGIGAVTAAFSAAPTPTLDPSVAFGSEAGGTAPTPEGDPADAKRVTAKR